MHVEPTKEHQWLQKLVGEWTSESECEGAPGQPRQKFVGTETVRSLGGLWTLGEGQGEMPGGGVAKMLMTLGYDPQRKRFVGTFVGSMMTHLWVYDGELDATGRVLTLNAEGPSFGPDGIPDGKTAVYQDIIEFKNDDHRVLTSQTPGEDGKWRQFMRADYRRAR